MYVQLYVWVCVPMCVCGCQKEILNILSAYSLETGCLAEPETRLAENDLGDLLSVPQM